MNIIKQKQKNKISTMNEIESEFEKFNVYLLNNKVYYYEDKDKNKFKFIGSTLWSDIDINISDYINEFY
jgi:hypothetical protein